MRLRLIVLSGTAVILALGGVSQQAGGAMATNLALWPFSPAAQDTGVATTVAAAQDTGAARPAAAQDSGTAIGQDPAAADTAAQDTTEVSRAPVSLSIGLKVVRLPPRVDLASRLPDPTIQRPELRLRVRDWGAVWAEEVRAQARGWEQESWLASRPITGIRPQPAPAVVADVEPPTEAEPAVADAAPDTPPPAPDTISEQRPAGVPADQRPTGDQPDLLPSVFAEYADIGMAIQGRVELGGGWERFRPCNVSLNQNCDPNLIPRIKPDIQFGARIGGTISDRIHMAVDYDNRREFDAANNINVYYQGLEDEMLQRVEVGDVNFPLPQSRYLTQGIPAGNFGFRATGQVGPIDLQGVWAQQKGDLGTRELQLGGSGQGYEQEATTILDDADYEIGRFFFPFNPRQIAGFPNIEIQDLVANSAPPNVRPASVVKVYRYEVSGAGAQVPEGFITAIATAVDTLVTEQGTDTVVTDTLTGLFRPLIDGEDYVLHRSGLWLQLRNTLPLQEALAITYLAADGSEIGTFEAEAQSDAHNADPENVPPPNLELIRGLNPRPGSATWTREMHHVYRVSASSGVVETSVELIISQGDPTIGNTFREADGNQLEFIKIFGVDDDPTDNRIDLAHIYEVTAGAEVIAGPSGTYIVFPTLEPFKLPPPLHNVLGLEGQPFPLAPEDQNTVIYDEPNDQRRRGTNLYLLTTTYRQRFEGFLSTISLGAGGVREGSERVVIDETELVRGQDYTIDYDIGEVELREPERWFAVNPGARVNVSFEQKPLFQLAPTSVFGFLARYAVGNHGEFNLIGLSQKEKTLQTRPELGLEPAAVQLGGLSGRLNFNPQWLTDLANALPGVNTDAPSTLNFDGEIALSLPTTNTQGITYVEDFEGGRGFGVALLSRAWDLGSAPSTTAGAEPIAPPGFALENLGELVWQDQYTVEGQDGPVIIGGLLPEQIDDQLLIQGQPRAEPVLTLTTTLPENRQIAPDSNPAPGPAWGSMTQVISTSGQDFTTIEFLEFYVAVSDAFADSTNLIVDLGTVSEDAFAIDSLGNPSGIGTMNREVDPPKVWSNADDIGLWDSGCEAVPNVTVYPLGDIAANCTRNNGLEDSEDLNRNSVLDTEERFFRYSVRIGDPSGRYFVREANEVLPGVRFRLYKIPLKQPDHRERVTDAEFQNIRHIRLTWVTNADNRLLLARWNFQGSRWLKRTETGVVEGLIDTITVVTPGAAAEVGPISTTDPRYVSPPGITDQVANATDPLAIGGQETFNEQSLAVAFNNVGPEERAEVYLQYAQIPLDFLAYRTMLVWALGPNGPWGKDGQPLRFLVKLGENSENFYQYKTSLSEVPEGASGTDLRQSWLPEIQIDFNRFIALRTKAEEIMLFAGGLPGDSTLMVWDVDVFEDGDSTYAVVIGSRSRAPNLAAIRQVSLGAYNSGATTAVTGELWVDDIRLTGAVNNTGVVGQVNLNMRASDVMGFYMSYSNENPYFRQLAQDPSFRSEKSFRVGGNLQLGEMFPDSWALSMPLNVAYSSASSQPVLLARSDVFVEQLPGLRAPGSRNLGLNVSLSNRPTTPTPHVGWLIDNSALRLSYDERKSQNSRATTETSSLSAGYSFRSDVGNISLPIPGTGSGFRLTPTTFQFNTGYVNGQSDTKRYAEIIELPVDTAVVPVAAFDERLATNTSIAFEPITALTGRWAATESRDLVPTDVLVSGQAAQDAINAERTTFLGVDLGWETGRTIDMNWTYRPNIATWLIPQLSLDTRYRYSRGPSFLTQVESDTVLTSDFNNSRVVRLSAGLNAPVLLRDIFGQDRGGAMGGVLGFFDWFDIFSATWSGSLSSRYQREPAQPNLGYQLALGGFDSFRVQDGDTASRVNDSGVLTLSTGMRLPLGAGFSVDYANNDQDNWTPISQSLSRTKTWPSVNFNWNRVPLPAVLSQWVSSLSLRTGYTVRSTRTDIIDGDQTRVSESRNIPLNVNLALTTEWSFSYSLNVTNDERRDPTGLTIGSNLSHAFDLRGSVRPLTTTGTFKNPVRISLRVSQDTQDQCRQLGAIFAEQAPPEVEGEQLPACEPFTDLRIRTIDLTVATDVVPFSLGLQGSWRDTQSELGQRPGNTQLNISLFGQFLFETGEIR